MASAPLLALAAIAATPTSAQTAEVGFNTALAACESWILEPATHAEDVNSFEKRSHLDGRIERQGKLPDIALPPPDLRVNLRSWRVPVGTGGYFVTVSDRLPMCHIAGGGSDDFQPGIESALKALVSSGRWKTIENRRTDDALSTQLVHGLHRKFVLIVTRAAHPGSRTDRPQVIATARYDIGE